MNWIKIGGIVLLLMLLSCCATMINVKTDIDPPNYPNAYCEIKGEEILLFSKVPPDMIPKLQEIQDKNLDEMLFLKQSFPEDNTFRRIILIFTDCQKAKVIIEELKFTHECTCPGDPKRLKT